MIRNVLVATSLLTAALGAVHLAARPMLVAPDPVTVDARLIDMANRAVGAEGVEERIATLLKAGRVERAGAYIALAGRLSIPISETLRQRHAEAQSAPEAILRGARGFALGFATGEAEDLAGLSGAVTADLLMWGDLRDLAIQGQRVVRDEPVDAFLCAASAIGLGLSAATVASGGGAAPLRLGVSAAKAAKRAGALTDGLRRQLTRLAERAIDWRAMKAGLLEVNWADRDSVRVLARRAMKRDEAARLRQALKKVGAIAEDTSPAEALRIIRHVENLEDLARAETIAARFGKSTGAVFDLLGRGAFKAFAKRAVPTALKTWSLIGAALSALFTAAGLTAAAAVWAGRRVFA